MFLAFILDNGSSWDSYHSGEIFKNYFLNNLLIYMLNAMSKYIACQTLLLSITDLPSDFDVTLTFLMHQVAVVPTVTLAARLSLHR